MKFEEALKRLTEGRIRIEITRDDWHYRLYFCPLSQNLMIKDSHQDISAYVISVFDFDYEWSICE